MMEIIIAVGLGAWFTVSISIACVALFKSFQKAEQEDDNI